MFFLLSLLIKGLIWWIAAGVLAYFADMLLNQKPKASVWYVDLLCMMVFGPFGFVLVYLLMKEAEDDRDSQRH